MATTFKVESGIQLLTRLQKKPNLVNFYPILFEGGPKPGEIIEVFSTDNSSSCLLIDIITEALIPTRLGGVEAGVLLYNTDGNLSYELLINNLRKKIVSRASNLQIQKCMDEELSNLLHSSLSNLSVLEIYDATQLYTSLYSFERILTEKLNISLVIFDTLTAFYWSEQGFKITKMDMYLKKLLKLIQRITKDYKLTILYTRPEYFCSSKNSIETLEGCSDKPLQPALEHINYQIQLLSNDDGSYQVNLKTSSHFSKKTFNVTIDMIKWL